MKTNQVLVLVKGEKYSYVDEYRTGLNIIKLLEKNKVPKVLSQFIDIDDETNKRYESYDITVKSIDKFYSYSDKKAFRVYFHNEGKTNRFIASDSNGYLDTDKFLKKASLILKEEQDYQDTQFKKRLQDKDDEIYLDNLNKKLENTGYEVSKTYGRFIISARAFDRNELEELLNTLNS